MTLKTVKIANGWLSALVVVCGTVYSILIGLIFKRLDDYLTELIADFSARILSIPGLFTDNITYYWCVGFAYIIPGLIGIIAALAHKKGGYIVQMVFCILGMLSMGSIFCGAITDLGAISLFDYKICYTNGVSCSCPQYLSCYEIGHMRNVARGAGVMAILGWVASLVATILAGKLACSPQTQPELIHHHNPSDGDGQTEMTYPYVHERDIPHDRGYAVSAVSTSQTKYMDPYSQNQAYRGYYVNGQR